MQHPGYVIRTRARTVGHADKVEIPSPALVQLPTPEQPVKQ